MKGKKIGIFFVDDHEIVRDGIKKLLQDVPEIAISGEASNGKELLNKIASTDTDIIIMDISIPDISGIELTKQICKKYPKIKVLILSMYTKDIFVTNAIAAGAKGYLPKNTTRNELIKAINEIYNGNEYYNETISKAILGNYISEIRQEKKPGDVLSVREKEILQMVAEGHLNKEIADKYFLSIRTVESHKHHIMRKLGIKNYMELIKYVVQNNIIEVDP